jgi:hypothetical protein
MAQFSGSVESAKALSMRDLRLALPNGLIAESIKQSDSALLEAWQAAMTDLDERAKRKDIWLDQLWEFANVVFRELWNKRIHLLRTRGIQYFLTCDHPVVIDYDTGLRPSEAFLPVGARYGLLFSAEVHERPNTDPFFYLPVQEVSALECGRRNRKIIHSAETFSIRRSAEAPWQEYSTLLRDPSGLPFRKRRKFLGSSSGPAWKRARYPSEGSA